MENTKDSKQTQQSIEPIKERLVSVDVLRGFDMFWITGGAGLFLGIFGLFGDPVEKHLRPQMEHVKWEGFHFYDLIFPLFVFIVGMSVVFSLQRLLKTTGKMAAYKRVLKRLVLLFILGIIYNGGIGSGLDGIRLLGVLQRLALTYFFTSILFIHFQLRGLIIAFFILIISYWALLTFIPVPGFGEPSFAMGQNWANWVDENFLPLHKHNGPWDPEGLLSTLPAIASSILGVFASLLLVNKKVDEMKKVYYYIGGGILMSITGYLWGLQFPVIKNIWSSSYVLVAGGYSFILLGMLYLVLDIWKYQKWALPFIWIGMNPITIYLARNFMDFNSLGRRFVGNESISYFGVDIGYFLAVSASLALTLSLARYMYNKRIFLRL